MVAVSLAPLRDSSRVHHGRPETVLVPVEVRMACQGSWMREAVHEPTVGHGQKLMSFVAAQLLTVSLPNHALEATAYEP